MLSGGMAGAVASAVTTPFDVIKTLLNTQQKNALSDKSSAHRGMIEAAHTVYQLRGPLGFFSGTTARVIYQIPSTAIAWSVYESFKFLIISRQTEED